MTYQSDGVWWDLVRFGFRLLYHEMAFTYDAVSYTVSLGEWRSWQRSALEFLPDAREGRLLEIAHGTGNLQLDLHEAGYQTIAYDYSAQMGQIAKAKLSRQGIDGQFTRGKAEALPFADGSFSAIVTTFPTNFIVQPETLSEAYRVLDDGGRLVTVLNGALTGGGGVASLIEWLYSITGQRTEETKLPAEFFMGYGFDVRSEIVPCDKSYAQLIILQK